MLENNKVYIHCRGGHGRAGLASAVFLIIQSNYNISPEEALKCIHDAHQKRPQMKSRWRKMGSPQTAAQKRFVLKINANLK